MEHDNEIHELIKATASKYLPDADVFLFGSRARKDADFDSDYDILLITDIELDPRQKLPLKTSIRKELLQSGIRSDILIQSRNEVKKKKRLPGHIIKNILSEAILL